MLTHLNKGQEQIHKDQNNLDMIINRKHEAGIRNYIQCKWLLKIELKGNYDHTVLNRN